MSRSLGCKVIAEGIETAAELKTVRALGISHGQGFFLGRPEKAPHKAIPGQLYDSVSAARQSDARRYPEVILGPGGIPPAAAGLRPAGLCRPR